MIQYIPIPRLTVSSPDIDLLLENLILEPGKTVNASSFFPYRLLVSTQNDVDIRKGLFRSTASMRSLATIKLQGFTIRADDVGFWMKIHHGYLLNFFDEGIASFTWTRKGSILKWTLKLQEQAR